LSEGGSLLLTGQDITEDLQTGAPFLRDVLHCDVREHDVGSRHLYGTVGNPVSEGLEIYITGTGGAGNQHAPSALDVLEGSTECFHYAMEDSLPAGVQGDYGSGKYIFLAFGLEAVSGMLQSNTRTDILTRAFDFFGVSAAPHSRHDVPTTISLLQNWPNPFNSSTTISFFVPPGENPVELVLYNLLGQRVRTLFSGAVQGSHTLRWDGRDNHGHDLPTGMYLYVLQAPDETRARKLILIR
ncbi:T9SS type A sorting domain-containing protein, partial [bacterium]|nr:T9SS type A sorting domain-containing protein [bacterium]